ncbi:outer membrane protein transport protein [Myxococcota bacterium]|nr:outer membrane protein transport protein [Myxococcota bacterium]
MKRNAALLWFLGLLACPSGALAAGFEYGPQGVHALGRGGAFTAGADDPSAIWWNPAALARMRGTRLMYNHTLSDLSLSFERLPARRCKGGPSQDPCDPDPAYNNGTGEVSFPVIHQQQGFFPMGISLGLTSDFGLKDWAFGLGLSGPAAFGKVSYPNTAPASGQTEPAVSASRYSVTDLDAMLAFVSLSAAYKYQQWFGVGITLQYVTVPWVRYSVDIVGPAAAVNQNDPAKNLNDLRVDLDVADWAGVSGIAGFWVRPLPQLELAMAARVAPIPVRAKGDLTISGTQNSIYARSAPVKVPGRLSFDYPVDLRAALRFVWPQGDREVFDVELDYAWEQWSVQDAFRIRFDQQEVEAFGTSLLLKSLELPRNLKDTHSLRLGGTWNALPRHLWVSLGGWWESGAQPKAYTAIDLPSWDRFGLGFGVRGAWRGIEVGISYGHVFQLSRTVEAGEGRVYQQLLDFEGNVRNGYPVNEGRYRSSFDVISLGLTILWEELVHGRPVAGR